MFVSVQKVVSFYVSFYDEHEEILIEGFQRYTHERSAVRAAKRLAGQFATDYKSRLERKGE